MVKKKGRGFRGPYIRGVVNVEESVGTIGSKGINLQVFPDSVTERCWISSIDVAWTLSNWTPLADAGPLLIGIAHSDYDSGEVAAFLDSVGTWDQGDLIQSREVSRRFIRQIGIFENPADVLTSVRMNDGKKIHTKCGFYLETGQTLNLFIFNLGGVSVSGASTPNIAGRGVAHLWPR